MDQRRARPLSASEVAQLKLNADWVVFSACNTAAGENPAPMRFRGSREHSSTPEPEPS